MEMKISHTTQMYIYIPRGEYRNTSWESKKTFSVSKAPRQSDAFKLPDVESTAKSLIIKIT